MTRLERTERSSPAHEVSTGVGQITGKGAAGPLCNMKAALKTILTTLVILGIISRLPSPANAFRMANDFFIINLGNFNSIAGQVSGGNNKLTFTSGELSPGFYSGTNYKLCAGFYGGIFCNQTSVASTSPTFEFSVNPTSIDFGTIDPTSPVSRTNTLTVTGSQPFTYTVTTRENHPLRATTNAFIPDTTCDNGLCSSTTATAWTNTLTYGFGYRCDNVSGTDCVIDFSTANYFKAFANSELGKPAETVMNGTTQTTGASSQITYKVNVSASQQPGTYTNTITYIAVPSF